MGIDASAVDIISLFCEGVMYGIFCALFCGVIYFHLCVSLPLQLQSPKSSLSIKEKRSHKVVFVVSLIMFIDSTVHIAFLLTAMLTHKNLLPKIAFFWQLHVGFLFQLLLAVLSTNA